MAGVEHIAGVYLTNPPSAGAPALAIAILAVLVAVTAFAWAREALAHR